MNIFQRIRINLSKIFKSRALDLRKSIKTEHVDRKAELKRISQKLTSERKNVIDKSKGVRIEKLSDLHESLIEEIAELSNSGSAVFDIQKIKQDKIRIELFEINFKIQSQSKFVKRKVDEELITNIKQEIEVYESIFDFKDYKSRKKSVEAKKLKDYKATVANAKIELSNFSLLNIHKKREEERIKKEAIESQEKIDSDFKVHIDNAEDSITSLDFDVAMSELEHAIKLKPNENRKIETLRKKCSQVEADFERRKQKFEIIFSDAEKYFHNNRLEEAIIKYQAAKELNINNLKCSKRISNTQNKIIRFQKIEKQKILDEKREKERIEKYKRDADAIIKFLKQNSITKFYHFTDSSNINSIIQNGGLYSWWYCMNHNINIKNSGSDELSKKLDKKYGLEDYIRMTYNNKNPMSFSAEKEGRIKRLEWLHVDLEVATFKHTIFTNMNATKNGFKKGADIEFLKSEVKFDVVNWKTQWDPITEEKSPYFQAEIMVKTHIPLQYIINL